MSIIMILILIYHRHRPVDLIQWRAFIQLLYPYIGKLVDQQDNINFSKGNLML
jgi:hypothetical protein